LRRFSVALERFIMLRRVLWLCLVAGVASSATARAQEPAEKEKAEEQQPPCKCHPKLVGKCFDVHGRLGLYPNAPTVRIWIIGTKRMLGLREGVPEWLEEDVEEKDNYLIADFVVCPLTRSKPGVMQLVCIESASNQVVVKKRS